MLSPESGKPLERSFCNEIIFNTTAFSSSVTSAKTRIGSAIEITVMMRSARLSFIGAKSPDDLDAVAFDHGVGEELLAHLLQLGAGLAFVCGAQFELDHLALADLADAFEAERAEGVADRLALR